MEVQLDKAQVRQPWMHVPVRPAAELHVAHSMFCAGAAGKIPQAPRLPAGVLPQERGHMPFRKLS